MSYLPMLILGLFASALGVVNLTGNVSSIHWYNRRKVKEEDIPRYGRMMGIGTLVIGGSLTLTAILQMIFDFPPLMYLILAGCVVGVALMLYAQVKYNRGIF